MPHRQHADYFSEVCVCVCVRACVHGCVSVMVISRPDWQRAIKLGAVSTEGKIVLECVEMQQPSNGKQII